MIGRPFQSGHDPRRAPGGSPKTTKGLAGDVVRALRNVAPSYIDNLRAIAESGDVTAQGVVVALLLAASAIRDGAGS